MQKIKTSNWETINNQDLVDYDVTNSILIKGYKFRMTEGLFLLFTALKNTPTGYLCEIRYCQDSATDITSFDFVSDILNKYNYCWDHNRGNPNPNFKYVAFGDGKEGRHDAQCLMKNILIDLNAPQDVIDSIESNE